MNLEFIKPQNFGSLLMKSSQSNFNLRSPGSHLVRSYLITTVKAKGFPPPMPRAKDILFVSTNLRILGDDIRFIPYK